MSELEFHKADLIEAVRNEIKQADVSKMRISLYSTVSICSFIALGAWYLSHTLDGIKQAEQDLAKSLNYKWSVADMAHWTTAFDKGNRQVQNKDGTLGLNVPEPVTVITSGTTSEPSE